MILLTGIYGSGKSTLCKKISSQTVIRHIRASDLIYHERQVVHPQDKRIGQIAENQQYLLKGFKKIKYSANPIVLEGHLCLLNKQHEIEYISLSIIQQLNISAIILLTADVHCVQNRLLTRDNVLYTIDELTALQEAEKIYTSQIMNILHRPVLVLNDSENPNIKQLAQFIKCAEDHTVGL